MKKIFYFFVFVLPTFAFAQLHISISTIAGTGTYGFSGDGGPGTNAKLKKPNSVAVDKHGNVFFIDVYNQRVRKITPAGIISTVVGDTSLAWMSPESNGDGGPATNAKMDFPTGIAVDTLGNLYIAEFGMQRVRKVDTNGIINTYAGNGLAGHTGDGGQATNAELWAPNGVAVDKAGNLYIAEFNNYCVRKVSVTGIISTIAGVAGSSGNTGDGGPATADSVNFSHPCGVTVDKFGNVYVADAQNNRVRKIDAVTGIISNFAGNAGGTGGTFSGEGVPATNSILYYPAGINIDDSGYLYIADFFNQKIRVVTPAGIIRTIAGSGSIGSGGDGGPATLAAFNEPIGVAADYTGNIYVADYLNNKIRKITPIHCVPHAGAISGSSFVSGCDSVRYTAMLPGGTWSTSGGHIAISDSGWVRAVSTTTFGTDTVTYSVQDTCGVAKVTALVTLLSPARYDSMSNIKGKKYICFDSSFTFTDSIQGGVWAVTNGNATITAGGLVQTHTDGADTVKYSFTDNCGTTTKTYHIWVLSKHQCDSVNSVPTIPTEESNINIYPNPVNSMLTIKTATNNYTSFTITNNLGAVIISQELQSLSSYIDVSRLPVGMYFIRFVGNAGIEVRKFLKE